jgi:hypothetical protein
MMTIIDILNCIPSTSVRCETGFSQMKLIKTCRRTKLRGSTLKKSLKNPYIEEQTTQWPKEKGQKDKQRCSSICQAGEYQCIRL